MKKLQMCFRPLVALVVLLTVSLSANADNFLGINYGPYHKPGQSPANGTQIPKQQIYNDISVISKKFKLLKTYGVNNGLQYVPGAAKQNNMKVYLGVYESPDYNGSANTEFLQTAISLAKKNPNTIKAIVVGNECLPTDTWNPYIQPEQLIADLQWVKSQLTAANLPNIQVTTELSYGGAQSYGEQIQPYVDIGMVNVYPYYSTPPIDVSASIANLESNLPQFISMFSPKQVIVGETGWASSPSGGQNSLQNEQQYFNDIVQWVQGSSGTPVVPTFYFEAYDEPWNPTLWGLWDQNRNPKFKITNVRKLGLSK